MTKQQTDQLDEEYKLYKATGDYNPVAKRLMELAKGIVRGAIGNHPHAEDIMQECVIHAWRQDGKYRGKARYSTWAYKVMDTQMRYELRALKPQASKEAYIEDLEDDIRDSLMDEMDDRAAILESAMKTLTPLLEETCRRVISGESTKEIADSEGVAESTIRRRWQEAIKKLESQAEKRSKAPEKSI